MNRMKMAKGERQMKPKKLHHMEVKEAENGGHVITHHFDNSMSGDGYHDPEQHVFGESEGHEAMNHIAEHANIKMSEPSESEGEETGENEEA